MCLQTIPTPVLRSEFTQLPRVTYISVNTQIIERVFVTATGFANSFFVQLFKLSNFL
jgi:hypothetical protein